MEQKEYSGQFCEACKYFIRHYVKWGIPAYHECGCGHCVKGRRTKTRSPFAKACEYWELGERTEDESFD